MKIARTYTIEQELVLKLKEDSEKTGISQSRLLEDMLKEKYKDR